MDKWCSDFRSLAAEILPKVKDQHYSVSANGLRDLVKSGVLRLTDLRDAPEKFFRAHSILSEWSTDCGPGFGIRFTVQVNLFAGTILALGSDDQVAQLDQFQKSGTLGCFALTERFTGVNSGLIVGTTATWDEKEQEFVVNCPDDGAIKNWISQGMTAEKVVVIADLIVGGKSVGPHAFMADYQVDGKLMPGLRNGDMGEKTIGNDLDNAWIEFKNVRLPKNSLLNRYADVIDNKYVQKVANIRNMDMIGQRLFTGRMVIAQSALVFARTLFKKTKAYTDAKKCWAPKGARPSLSEIPQLKELYAEADTAFDRIDNFMTAVEATFQQRLRENAIVETELQDAIAVAKVKGVEVAIEFCNKLKQEVGSYALMGGTGFERIDYLQCTKFAEGDSRILMQKMARDRMIEFKKSPGEGTAEELELCTEIASALMAGGPPAWDASHRKVYGLAQAVCERSIDEWDKARPKL